jgi:hypothetical protein
LRHDDLNGGLRKVAVSLFSGPPRSSRPLFGLWQHEVSMDAPAAELKVAVKFWAGIR